MPQNNQQQSTTQSNQQSTTGGQTQTGGGQAGTETDPNAANNTQGATSTSSTGGEGDNQQNAGADDGKGGKTAILADLATERDKRQNLEQQINELKSNQQQQTDALAKAFGFGEGEKPEADKLAEQINNLQEKFTAAERRTQLLEVAADNEIPKEYHHLLTATEPDALAEQAKTVAELVKAKGQSAQTPAFEQNNGQGQGSGSASVAEQLAAAQKTASSATPGSQEQKTAQAQVMALKTQQLAAANKSQ